MKTEPGPETRRRATGGKDGFTLIEVVVALAIIAALIAILSPVATEYIADSRVTRAQNDVGTVGDALVAGFRDMGDFPVFRDGSNRSLTDAATYDILFGPGDVPGVAGSVSGGKWDPLADGVLDDAESGDDAGALSEQLVSNAPGYPTTGRFEWRGPYTEDLTQDPWGNAYVVNAENLRPDQGEAAYVLSAGANGLVETPFEIDRETGDVAPGGDDVLYRLR